MYRDQSDKEKLLSCTLDKSEIQRRRCQRLEQHGDCQSEPDSIWVLASNPLGLVVVSDLAQLARRFDILQEKTMSYRLFRCQLEGSAFPRPCVRPC